MPFGSVVTSTYNAEYRRIKQEHNTGTRKYIWDEENLLHQRDEFDDVELDYHYEHQLYGILLETYDRAAAEVQYPLTDALGSEIVLLDDNETQFSSNLYSAWGQPLQQTGTPPHFGWIGSLGYQPTPYGITIRRRVYSVEQSRWLSDDPLGLSEGGNLFAYVRNRPLNSLDPSGLDPFIYWDSGEGETERTFPVLGLSKQSRAPSSTRFSTIWSRGGDDEPRTYETARIAIVVVASNSECESDCDCTGLVKFKLHYHAKVGGAFAQAVGFNFGLCHGSPSVFTKFTSQRHPGNGRPNTYGYRYFYELVGEAELKPIPCSGGSASESVAVSTKAYCDNSTKGRIAEEITVRTYVSKCGQAFATTQLIELATGAGFPHPIRCISCFEKPYPPAPIED